MVAQRVIFVQGRLFDLKKFAEWCVMENVVDKYYEKISEEHPEWYADHPIYGPLTPGFKELPDGWYEDFCNTWTLKGRQLMREFEYVDVFEYPCCSPLAKKYVIVGEERKRYTRIAREPWNDDGIDTENGVYNFSKIFDNVVCVDGGNMCKRCYHHFNSESSTDASKCPKCKSTYKVKNNDSVDKINFSSWNNMKDFLLGDEGFYLTLDDCASCT